MILYSGDQGFYLGEHDYRDKRWRDRSAEKKLKARRAELGEDNPAIPFNKVIEAYWDYGSEQRAKSIELSNRYHKGAASSIPPKVLKSVHKKKPGLAVRVHLKEKK